MAWETIGLSQYQQTMNRTAVVYPSIWIDYTASRLTLPIQFTLPIDKAISTLEDEIAKATPVVGNVEIEINPILAMQGKMGERQKLSVSAPTRATFQTTPTHIE